MKCPLLSAGYLSKGKWKEEVNIDCLEAECAWWNDNTNKCSVYSAMLLLGAISKHLGDIFNKIPHTK